VRVVGALEGGGEPEPGGRREQPRHVTIPLAAEVVDLVEDDELEGVADILGFQVRRVVRRHRDRLLALFAAAEPPDRYVELRF